MTYLGMSRKHDGICSEALKREISEAHRKFFEKRGINPTIGFGDFLFGARECPMCERPWPPPVKKCECGYAGRPVRYYDD